MPEVDKDIEKKEQQDDQVQTDLGLDRTSEIRSESVQDILSHVPHWMIRWGISLIFLVLLMLIVFSWFIKYPDLITGKAILTTENPPVRLVAQTNAKLQSILIFDGENASANQELAILESPLASRELDYLEAFIIEIFDLLDDPEVELRQPDAQISLGPLQTSFSTLWSSAFEYRNRMTDDYDELKIKSLEDKIEKNKSLVAISQRQIAIVSNELQARQEVYQDNKRLFEEGVIGKMEFYTEEATFRQKEMELENIKRVKTELEISSENLEQELRDKKYELVLVNQQKKNQLILELNATKSALEDWRLKHEFVSPVDGKLVHLGNWSEGQFIEAGTELFAVVPENRDYQIQVKIPARGFGKVRVGHRVRINMDGYPSSEYGYLQGKVTELREMTLEDNYLAVVELDNGLTTTHNIQLEYNPEMAGEAQIITDDLRLFERLFINFRKALRRE
jgi:multidrug efflux pump subunit AcrA (membrane-fusion protein)